MAKTKKAGILLINAFALTLLIILLSSQVSAQSTIEIQKYSSDFGFFTGATNAEPSVCACGSAIDTIIITNTGTYASSFTIQTNIPQYATLPFSTISLAPGQSVEVQILLSAACSESEKTRNYEVTITSTFGESQVIKRNLGIMRCQSISANLYAEYNETLPCVPVNYVVELENKATFTEKYYVEPINFKESFTNQKYELTLNPGQKGIVNTTLHFECSIYGEKNIGFNIHSVNNNIQAQLYHKLNIIQDYGFNATIPAEADACQYENGKQFLQIKNTANIPNDYKISLKTAPAFVSLSETQKSLEPGEQWDIVMNIAPDRKTQGTYNFKVRIETAIGDTFTEQDVKLNIHDCYSASVTIDAENPPNVCTGASVIPVLVKNKGFQAQNISLEVIGDDSAVIFPKYMKIEPGHTATAEIQLITGEDILYKEMPLTVKAKLADRDSWLEWQDSITVKVYSQYSCTLPEVSKKGLSAKYEDEKVSFQLTNKGFEDAVYDLYYNGDSFLRLESDEFTLSPGESEWVNILMYSDDSEAQKEYYFTIHIKSDTNGQTYSENFHLKLRNNNIFEDAWLIVNENVCNKTSSIILVVLLLTLILFVVALATEKIRISKKCKIIIAALAVLVIIAAIVVYGWPKSTYPALDNEKVDDKLYLTWYQGDSYTVDLSEYFVDPDGDVLNFSVDEVPENFTISINGNIAVLTPDNEWFGESRIRFVAQDEYGDEATSPRMDIEVVEVPKYTIGQYHQIYCAYVNAVLIFLILIVLLFFPLKRPKKQPEEGKVLNAKVKKESGYRYFVDKDGDVARTKVSAKKKTKRRK